MQRALAGTLVALLAACASDSPSPPLDGAADTTATDAGPGERVPPPRDAGVLDSVVDQGPGCPAGARPGAAGTSIDGQKTAGGVAYNVRTPAGYDPRRARPLVVVFAPSGGSAAASERATGLTPDALDAGYLIAYVDHVSPTDVDGVKDVASVPRLVAEHWCVDETRIYLTGASDGGSVIHMMLLNGYLDRWPAAVAPVAAGASAKTLASASCPSAPLSLMIAHAADDAVFPGYGAQARDWWLACNGCDAAAPPATDGCAAHAGCRAGVEVRYCEGSGGHGSWPPLNRAMLAFFDRFAAP